MAIGTGDGEVSTGQRETGGLVLGDGEGGAVKIGDGMARFAAIGVRSSGKLLVVGVFVAIGAGVKLHLVNGVLACRDVTARTYNVQVFAREWITGSAVFFHAE